ncbi:TonB-dependent receptor plug domain-containing protein [Spirosoma pomorum]
MPTVRIRGTDTLLGGADPLYVVDGIITEDIRNINTSDITSVDVLKDASATAIHVVRTRCYRTTVNCGANRRKMALSRFSKFKAGA